MSIINICQNKRQELLQEDRDKVAGTFKTLLYAFAIFVVIFIACAIFASSANATTHTNSVAMVDRLDLAMSDEIKQYQRTYHHGKKPLLEDVE